MMARGRKKDDLTSIPLALMGPWNPQLVCDYFDKPTQLLTRVDFVQWIAHRGGFDAIDTYLRRQRLSNDDRALLNLLLDNPLESPDFYAGKIGAVRTTYYRRRLALAEQLAHYLNAWPAQGSPAQFQSSGKVSAPVSPFAIEAPLIGREQEMEDIQALLDDDTVRLVSLTGLGGVGKTRLARQLVPRMNSYFDHVWFVSLATVSDVRVVPQVLANTINMKETRNQQLIHHLKLFFQERCSLLILDNLEQIIAVRDIIDELLTTTSQLKILITSRVPIKSRFEHELAIQPLVLPHRYKIPSLKVLSRNPAVHLFVDRAQTTNTDFMLNERNATSIVAICHRLEGLPLAIELAAARLRILSPDEIVERLQKRLKLLVGTASHLPQRQQTMRNTIAWSYELLSPYEQRVFARFATFVNGWTVAAAEALCAHDGDGEIPDAIESLINNNLIYRQEGVGDMIRLGMLETIREFAFEQLVLMEEVSLSCYAHMNYYIRLAEAAEPELRGGQQAEWIQRLNQDIDNIRSALRYANESNHLGASACIASALWLFWIYGGHTLEGYDWICQSLRDTSELTMTHHVKTLLVAGNLALNLTESHQARSLLKRCFDLATTMGDKHTAIKAQGYLAKQALLEGDYQQGKRLVEESLQGYRDIHDILGIAFTLRDLAQLYHHEADYDQALRCYQESIDLYRTQSDRSSLALSLGLMGELVIQMNQSIQAETIFQEAYGYFEEIGDKWGKAWSLYNLGYIRFEQQNGPYEDLLVQALQLYSEIDNIQGAAYCLALLAHRALQENQHDRAACLLACSTKFIEMAADNMPAADKEVYDRRALRLKEQLTPSILNIHWEQGYNMSLKDVVEYAVEYQ